MDNYPPTPYASYFGLGPNIGHSLLVGWVGHPDILCWVSFLNPTYLPAIFLLSAKPNKMAEDRTILVISLEEGVIYIPER